MGETGTTRGVLLREALAQAALVGVSGLTFGDLAARTGRSKSGLFAHFGSKENLQLAVLELARQEFLAAVVAPAMTHPRGLARLRALAGHWLDVAAGDEPARVMLGAAVEFHARPGPLRDKVAADHSRLTDTATRLVAAAVRTGELAADVDPAAFVEELGGLALARALAIRLLPAGSAMPDGAQAVDSLLRGRTTMRVPVPRKSGDVGPETAAGAALRAGTA